MAAFDARHYNKMSRTLLQLAMFCTIFLVVSSITVEVCYFFLFELIGPRIKRSAKLLQKRQLYDIMPDEVAKWWFKSLIDLIME